MTSVPPLLLYDGACHTCRIIAHWVERSAERPSGPPRITVRAIGQDPAAIRRLNPKLDIWAAYATVHVLMPDGSMRQDGDAVAEVFKCLPATKWIAWLCARKVAGREPFQALLNLAYVILADIRPLIGCESCGRPSPWVRPALWAVNHAKRLMGYAPKGATARHFNPVKSPGTAKAPSN